MCLFPHSIKRHQIANSKILTDFPFQQAVCLLCLVLRETYGSSEQVMIAILPSKKPSYCVENPANSLLLAAIYALYLKFLSSNLINQVYSEVPYKDAKTA